MLRLALLLSAFTLSAAELNSDAAALLEESSRFFTSTWRLYFRFLPDRPVPPRTIAFTGKSTSACGRLPAGNAYYCQNDNTIYYDTEFLEELRKRIAAVTGTPGNAAPIVALAHELGHAIYAQQNQAPSKLPYQRLNGYGEEKMADCLAGVVLRQAYEAGVLNEGHLREAEQTMISIGEPQNFTERYLRRHKSPYPNWRVRRDTFLSGFQSGTPSCNGSLIEKLHSRP